MTSRPPSSLDLDCHSLPFQRLALALARIGRRHPYVGLTDPDEVLRDLIKRSLLVRPLLHEQRPVMDVGCGVGIPGLPLALAEPERPVWLVEPRTPCVALIRWILDKLPPLQVQIFPQRLDAVDFSVLPPCQVLTRAALNWEQLLQPLPSRTQPVIRWAGPRVDPPPSVPGRIRCRITLEVESLSQTFYWVGSPELFHVKQSAWSDQEPIQVETLSS